MMFVTSKHVFEIKKCRNFLKVKMYAFKVPVTSTQFSTLFILRNRPKYIVSFLELLADWNFTFYLF